MHIEAFSAGKNPMAPERNEDRFVVLPGRAYAVIDGVTDRTGAEYGNKSSGQIAAELVQASLERLLAADTEMELEPLPLLELLSGEIVTAYRKHGLLEQARSQPNLRFGATLALFRHRSDGDELVLVGDSGIRLNGSHVLQVDKPLDSITASLRVAAWQALERQTSDAATLTRVARQIVFHGGSQGVEKLEGLIDAAALAQIAATAVARSASAFPDLPIEAIAAIVYGGIVNGQFPHQNSDTSVLGYSCIDGFAIPSRHVTIERRAPGKLRCVELFTDGYFAQPDGFGVIAWEAAADEVERVDPFKIGNYPSVKGSLGNIRTDDRTYVGVIM